MEFPIQITTRCNMKCSHCMFDCSEIGEDMNINIFKKSVDLIFKKFRNYDGILLTGGEPTIHPMILEFVEIAMKYFGRKISIITNGKKKGIVLKLIDLALKEGIYLSLSQDKFHEKIDKDLVDRFVLCEKIRPNIRIKQIKKGLLKAGRSKEGCEVCNFIEPIIDTNGIIWENFYKKDKISDVFFDF